MNTNIREAVSKFVEVNTLKKGASFVWSDNTVYMRCEYDVKGGMMERNHPEGHIPCVDCSTGVMYYFATTKRVRPIACLGFEEA